MLRITYKYLKKKWRLDWPSPKELSAEEMNNLIGKFLEGFPPRPSSMVMELDTLSIIAETEGVDEENLAIAHQLMNERPSLETALQE